MKIKPLYIYIGVIVLAIVFLVIFSTEANKDADMGSASSVPQDEMHKGVTPPSGGCPSGSDVASSVYEKMDALKKAHEANPEDTLRMREYAEFLAAAHRPGDAIPLYENILKKDPKRTDIRFAVGLIYFQRRDLDKAEELVKGILSYDKNNGQATYNMGAISASRGEFDKAKTYWEKVIKEHPGTPIAGQAQESISSINK